MFSRQSVGVSLAELFPSGRFHYTRDIRVTSCCVSAELCRPGDLYVALLGPDGDSHFQAAKAVQRGAAALLTERLLPVEIPQCVVRNSSHALSRLCQRLAGSPAVQMRVVGIAGHRGKTVTRLMLSAVLAEGGHRPAMFSRLGYTDGTDMYATPAGTVSPHQFAAWLATVASLDCTHAVTELSREPVMRHTFSGVPLRMLVLSGLSTSTHRHSPSPKTRAYVQRMLKQLRGSGTVIANIDCPIVRDLIQQVDHPVLTVSTEQPADVMATRLEQFPSEQTFLVQAGEQTSVVRSPLVGDTHLSSSLLAIGAGLAAGVDLVSSVRAVESLQSVPGHLERIECGQAFSLFADGANSNNQLRDALLALREVTEGRLLCVLGAGVSRRPELRALRGSVAERYADSSIITSDAIQDPEPLRTAHDVLDGFRNPGKAHVMPNRTRAIGWALDHARPGDTVLLAGAHNHQVVREDNEFPLDAVVARFHLFDRASRYGDAAISTTNQQQSTGPPSPWKPFWN